MIRFKKNLLNAESMVTKNIVAITNIRNFDFAESQTIK